MSPTRASAWAAELRINIKAPLHPISTPMAFFPVMGSCRISAASIMAKIGIDVVTMLALMGEVMLSPMVKQHWLKSSPVSAAPMNIRRSRQGTCSFGANSDAIQNSRHAPATRNVTMVMPSNPWSMASLPTGDISPHPAHAPNMARWAMSALFVFMRQK